MIRSWGGRHRLSLIGHTTQAIVPSRKPGKADAIRLFTSNSMRGLLHELLPRFERASGHAVVVSYDPAKVMLARINAGEGVSAPKG